MQLDLIELLQLLAKELWNAYSTCQYWPFRSPHQFPPFHNNLQTHASKSNKRSITCFFYLNNNENFLCGINHLVCHFHNNLQTHASKSNKRAITCFFYLNNNKNLLCGINHLVCRGSWIHNRQAFVASHDKQPLAVPPFPEAPSVRKHWVTVLQKWSICPHGCILLPCP